MRLITYDNPSAKIIQTGDIASTVQLFRVQGSGFQGFGLISGSVDALNQRKLRVRRFLDF